MKVKLTTSRVLANGQTQDSGMEVEMEPEEAARMFSEGQAERLGAPRTAMTEPAENAMKPSGKANKAGNTR